MSKATAQELIPLSPPVFHVLLALGDTAMHGYAMMQSFEAKTSGAEALLPGTQRPSPNGYRVCSASRAQRTWPRRVREI